MAAEARVADTESEQTSFSFLCNINATVQCPDEIFLLELSSSMCLLCADIGLVSGQFFNELTVADRIIFYCIVKFGLCLVSVECRP